MKIQKIAEGAESYIYSGNFLGFDGILKRRIEKNYRLKIIDGNLRTQRTKNEARILGMVSSLGISSPRVILVDKYDIYMNRLYGTGLSALLDSKHKNSKEMDRIFDIIGSYAAILHNNNIAHGDYTPANIIIGKDESVYLIDFGLSEMTISIEEKALDLLLMKRSIDKQSFKTLMESYRKKNKQSKIIMDRLKEIEKRGRYNTRSLMVE